VDFCCRILLIFLLQAFPHHQQPKKSSYRKEYTIHVRKKTTAGQSRMDNPEKPATQGTEDEDKQNKKHNTEN